MTCDAKMSPAEFEKSSLVSEEPNACGSSGKSFHVQVKKCEREAGLRRFTTTSLRVMACKRQKISQMEVVEDVESRPYKAVSFLVASRKGDAGMSRAEAAEGATW